MPTDAPSTDLPASTVEMHRDEWGIPHLRARSRDDAFFAMGYVHAQDRLFQMDTARRRMQGRWAEWVGADAVPADSLARRLSVARACRRDHDALDPETRQVLAAYTAGVNARLDARAPLPLEYELLGVTPEPWEPWHCIAALRNRCYLQGSLWFKLWRAAALRAVGPEQVAALRYDDGGTDLLCIPPGNEAPRWLATLQELSPAIEALARLADPDATVAGSNNWAVAGERTASGRPLLAGDPHRVLDLPSMYTQIHVACDEFDAIGLSIAGVPGLPFFGHNGAVAWGITHAFADMHDLYVEQISPDAGRYLTETGWHPTRTRTEQVAVRDAEPVDVEIVETHHGPVVAGDPGGGTVLVLRAVQFTDTDSSAGGLLPMLHARSCTDLFAATRGWGLVGHNLVAADTAGNIGHLVRAVVPRRPRLNGWLPVPGWTGEYDWDGTVPWENMPRALNPDRGYVATANNRLVSDDAPDYIHTDCHPPYRARRIEELLAAMPKARVADMLGVHADVLSPIAPLFQQQLATLDVAGDAARLRTRIVGWDARLDPDSRAAVAYTRFRWALTDVLAERCGLDTLDTDPSTIALPGAPTGRAHLRWVVPALLRTADTALLNGWTWEEALTEALRRAAAIDDGTAWGERHTAALVHPLAATFPDAAARLNPAGAALGGDNDTVRAAGTAGAPDLRAASGAVARYVFDLGDWDASRWIVLSGSAGHPDDPHYLDQHAAWARCATVPMHYSWSLISARGRPSVLNPRLRAGPRGTSRLNGHVTGEGERSMSAAAGRPDRELSSPTERYAERIQPRTSAQVLRRRLIERETATLAEAFDRFSEDDTLVEAAALVVAARRRFIVGYGRSFTYATLLAWDLSAGLAKVTLVDGTTVRPLDVLSDTQTSDVLVAFSFRRYQRQTVQLAEQFTLAGGTVVAITDNPDAPIAPYAQQVLTVPTSSASYADSPTAVVAISHLLSALTTASAKGARRRLTRRDRLRALLHDYVD